MPKFPKGSQEAKDYMASIRKKRQGGNLISGLKKIDKFNMGTAKKVDKYVEVVAKGRKDYPPKVRTILKKYGDQTVISAELRRAPVQSLLVKAMDAITFGKFSENMADTPYDSLFHLQIVFTLSGGKKIMVEKNEVINMAVNAKVKPKSEVLAVSPMKEGLTFQAMMDATKARMGDKFLTYSARDNNCQDFIMAILQANGIGNTPAFEFVKQDTKTLFKGLSGLSKVANVLTSAGAKVNEITQGAGVESSKVDVSPELMSSNERQQLIDRNKELELKIAQLEAELALLKAKQNTRKSQDGIKKTAKKMMEGITDEQITEIKKKSIGKGVMKISRPNKKLIMKGEGAKSSKVSPSIPPMAEVQPAILQTQPENDMVGRVGAVVETPMAERQVMMFPAPEAELLPMARAMTMPETPQMKQLRKQIKEMERQLRKVRQRMTMGSAMNDDVYGITYNPTYDLTMESVILNGLNRLDDEYTTLNMLNENPPTTTTSLTPARPPKEGSGMKRKFAKGSQEAKDFMKSLRDKRKN